MKKPKVLIVLGTKAELIKTMPVIKELEAQNIETIFVHTSQHNLTQACKEYNIKQPDYILGDEPDRKKGTKFWAKITPKTFIWCLKTTKEIRKLIRKLKPDYVMYHGDTMNTAMAGAASCNILNPFKKWQTVHLEAGLRSGSIKEPFPEEFSRRIVDRFSDILLAVSDHTVNNLKKEKNFARGKIFNPGNTVLDSVKLIHDENNLPPEKDYALVNVHRYENLKNSENLKKIAEIINSIKTPVIWPIHEQTREKLKELNLYQAIQANPNINITDLVPYKKFLGLIANCKFLLTDGGSIQEESLYFKKPCLILRNVTERPEGLHSGINFLTKLDVKYSKKVIKDIEEGKVNVNDFQNPYGEPGVSKKIVEILLKENE